MQTNLILSKLGHTWLFDIDGTIVKHNGYRIDGHDSLLAGVKEFWKQIPDEDRIILLTSREEKLREITISFLEINKIRFDAIIFGLPFGERILVNDDKISGLCMSLAVRLQRDEGIQFQLSIDSNL